MKPLAEPAIAAVERGEIQIIPDNRREEYFNWMRNIRDWTLSRQLWWGHRIPAWHCGNCREIIVARKRRELHEVWIWKTGTDPDVPGYVVQLRIVALFHTGLARGHPRLQDVLPDELADHRLRRFCFFGSHGNDHAGPAFHRESSLPRCLPPFHRAYPRRGKDVEVQRHGIDPIDVNRRYGTDAMRFTLGGYGVGKRCDLDRGSHSKLEELCEQNLECGRVFVREPG